MTISGYCPVGGASIFFETAGVGRTVLFLHAAVADSRMWRDQMGLESLHTVTFDQRGFGKTSWVPEPYANRTDALALLDHLGLDRAVIVGCSNGGEAAMQLAIIAPERVSALVLVGTAPRGWQPEAGWEEEPLWEETVAAFKAGDFDRVVDLDARTWLAGPSRDLGDVDEKLVDLFRDMDRPPQETESERDEYVQTLDPPTNDQLDRIEAPTLVVVGEHDLPNLHEAATYLAARLSDRPAVVLEETAHLPSLDQPDRFNQSLTGFLHSL
jgi:pimeloyl-ACP methyl ester carboxylesterase